MTNRRDEGVGLDALWHGLPGHPIHPPLTGITVGAYTFALVAATADVLGISMYAATHAWWLALVFGLLDSPHGHDGLRRLVADRDRRRSGGRRRRT